MLVPIGCCWHECDGRKHVLDAAAWLHLKCYLPHHIEQAETLEKLSRFNLRTHDNSDSCHTPAVSAIVRYIGWLKNVSLDTMQFLYNR